MISLEDMNGAQISAADISYSGERRLRSSKEVKKDIDTNGGFNFGFSTLNKRRTFTPDRR